MVIKLNIMRKLGRYINQTIRQNRFKRYCIFGESVIIDSKCIFEGKNRISDNTKLLNVSLGYGSYVGQNSFFVNTEIGKYSSIGDNINIIVGRHPISNFVSTHPSFYSTNLPMNLSYVSYDKFNEYKYYDNKNKISVKIGNDVWIGSNSIIMEGVRIGDGSVIAAGSIVTKDVNPYSIVGGVPAKIIKYRFSDEDIKYLLNFKWWDKETQWIEKNAGLFEDISILKKSCKK